MNVNFYRFVLAVKANEVSDEFEYLWFISRDFQTPPLKFTSITEAELLESEELAMIRREDIEFKYPDVYKNKIHIKKVQLSACVV